MPRIGIRVLLGCVCALMVASCDAAIVFGACGVLEPAKARYFWPAALQFANATTGTAEVEWLILGPESEEVGNRRLREAIARVTENLKPSPNDSTQLSGEVRSLRQRTSFLSLWDRRVGRSVRDKYLQSEERFAIFAVQGAADDDAHRLLPQFEQHILREIQVQGQTRREPQVAATMQAYRVRPLHARAPAPRAQTSLVTHCTIDRLDRLKTLLLSWGGVASVAIYVKPTEAIALVTELALQLAKANVPSLQVDIALVHGLHSSQEYPINTVRNVAVAQANKQDTPLVFMVDVDFVTSRGLRGALDSPEVGVAARTSLIVVPAFEWLQQDAPLPTTFEELVAEHANGTARQFHVTQCRICHGPTDYERWFSSSSSWTASGAPRVGHSVAYREFYEPYLLVPKDVIQMYDEQFVGYGFNKQVQILHMMVSGRVRTLSVLLREFIIAAEHPATEMAKRFAGRHSWYRYHKLASYFEAKRRILQGTYQPSLSPSTQRLLTVG